MGEYANYNGNRIKIGTCESLFYLRYEDISKLQQSDPIVPSVQRFRLPFPDEDSNGPGNYADHNRASRLLGFMGFPDLAEDSGTFQVSHQSGLLLNVPCYHGFKLPETGDIKAFWNGKDSSNFELEAIGKRREAIRPIIRCRHCEKSWNVDWSDIVKFIEPDLKERLQVYIDAEPVPEIA